jgi:cobalt-zinc-cadmium efflux system membrane fusion protein
MINNKHFKSKQFILIVAMLVVTAILTFFLLRSPSVDKTTSAEDSAKQTIGNKDAKTTQQADQHENSEIELTAEQQKAIGLQIDMVASANIAPQIDLAGELKLDTDRQAHVSSPFAGKVESVLVSSGQIVKKGQPLATIFNPELVTLQANLSAAKAKLSLNQSVYEREKSLWQQGISAKQDLQQAENSRHLAEIEMISLKQQAHAYGVDSTDRSGRLVLTAPISGHLVAKDITVGESIQTANQLFTIADLTSLWVEFAVSPTLVSQITLGMRLDVLTSPSSLPIQATLLTYTPSADAQTRNLMARAKIEAVNSSLRPNMLVTVQLKDQAKQVPLAVKTSAIQTIQTQNVIFVQEIHDGKIKFRAQPVVLGTLSENGYREVLSGVDVGTPYVSQGSFSLKSELEKGSAAHDH